VKHWSNFGAEVRDQALPKGPSCGVGRLLRGLHPEAREEIEKALGDGNLSTTAIHRALRTRLGQGAPSAWTLGNHRRGNCRCQDEA